MKNLTKLFMGLLTLPMFTACSTQIKNAQTDTVKVYGNCDMCKKTIETAGNVKTVATVDWNKDTKMATLVYDAKSTTQDEILQRIAKAGYDSDKFFASDETYNQLPECCHYDRAKQGLGVSTPTTETTTPKANTDTEVAATPTASPDPKPFKAILAAYYEVKDALVNTDATAATSKAKLLQDAINAVKMDALDAKPRSVWMAMKKDLALSAEAIAKSTDIEKQRQQFMGLSQHVYDLMKTATLEAPIYYQHCPMANDGKGANWLSNENKIKNPYYGAEMMTCGKVLETIK